MIFLRDLEAFMFGCDLHEISFVKLSDLGQTI